MKGACDGGRLLFTLPASEILDSAPNGFVLIGVTGLCIQPACVLLLGSLKPPKQRGLIMLHAMGFPALTNRFSLEG